jgi:hypothetical protein
METNWFKRELRVNSQIHMKYVNTLCWQNTSFSKLTETIYTVTTSLFQWLNLQLLTPSNGKLVMDFERWAGTRILRQFRNYKKKDLKINNPIFCEVTQWLYVEVHQDFRT